MVQTHQISRVRGQKLLTCKICWIVAEIEKVPWYKNLDRKSANSVLSERKIDGDFVVRPSSKKDNVCCLSVFQEDQVFHINVRRRSDGFLALGKSKPNENCFRDVQEIVQCYTHEKLFINSNGKKVNTILKYVSEHSLDKIIAQTSDCNAQ